MSFTREEWDTIIGFRSIENQGTMNLDILFLVYFSYRIYVCFLFFITIWVINYGSIFTYS